MDEVITHLNYFSLLNEIFQITNGACAVLENFSTISTVL